MSENALPLVRAAWATPIEWGRELWLACWMVAMTHRFERADSHLLAIADYAQRHTAFTIEVLR